MQRASIAVSWLLVLGLFGCTGSSHGSRTVGDPSHDLTFHTGPVMHTASVYAIFWGRGHSFEPHGSDYRYQRIIERFFRDVGGTSYYGILTQYSHGPHGQDPVNGPILNKVSLGGVYIDHSVPDHRGTRRHPIFLLDLQNEVERVAHLERWSPGLDQEYFLFLPSDMSVCDNGQRMLCTFRAQSLTHRFCAYHTTDFIAGKMALYAVVPDIEYTPSCPHYRFSHTPDGDSVADPEVGVTAHEFFETATDPLANGWYFKDARTGEITDRCEALHGLVPVHLSAHTYLLPEQWSNAVHGCTVG